MPRSHALLSPSSAHRWLKCPGSARLEEQFPDTVSEAAEEGTQAHAVAESILRDRLKAFRRGETVESPSDTKSEMERHAESYADFCIEQLLKFPDPKNVVVFIEHKVDFGEYVPEGFGSCDLILVQGHKIHVIDYKYGKGVPVDATDNPQLKLYALGAFQLLEQVFDIKKIEVSVFQPRIDNITTWLTSTKDLLDWAVEIKPVAIQAFEGAKIFKPSEDACRFCKARERCRARVDYILEIADFKDLDLLSDEELVKLYNRAPELKRWATEITDYLREQALSGHKFPGLKLVQGRSRRVFSDEKAVLEKLLKEGYTVQDVGRPEALTRIEKTIGKKNFDALLGDLVEKKFNRPSLVSADDKRPEYKPAELAFEILED